MISQALGKNSDRKWLAVSGLASLFLFATLLVAFPHHRWNPVARLMAKPAQRAFYYWKTTWTTSAQIDRALAEHKIGKLYMRFFDVEWDTVSDYPKPVSPLIFNSPLPQTTKIIPVVYITNAVFLKLPSDQTYKLADQIWNKVSSMALEKNLVFKELQIDCDWSDHSRERYFQFATALKEKMKKEKILVSSTIRLHQIKYFERTGIPPVDRGMLMFYNFGRIQADSNRSSIFNEADAKKYSTYIKNYPMPLDLSLPVFSWLVHSRDGKVIGLLERMDIEDFKKVASFEIKDDHRFIAKSSFFYHGIYYREGDMLLLEESNPEITNQAATLALDGAARVSPYQTVAFFDLDERNLNHYANNEINQMFGRF